jgi:hypothetical protein
MNTDELANDFSLITPAAAAQRECLYAAATG